MVAVKLLTICITTCFLLSCVSSQFNATGRLPSKPDWQLAKLVRGAVEKLQGIKPENTALYLCNSTELKPDEGSDG